MTFLRMWFVTLFIEPWLKRCRHEPEDVAADILEGDGQNQSVAYCRCCGAVQVRNVIGPASVRCGEWRRPRPLWCKGMVP